MIVRNEEEDLPRCLDSVKDIVDEMVIVDTGSTDSTIAIARKYGAKVFFYKWDNNFSNARNFALEHASGDWILLMDADDELEKEDKFKLLDLLKNADCDAYFFETLSYVGDKPGLDIIMNLNIRLVKNHKGYRFEGAIHEQLASNIIRLNKNAKIKTEKIRIHHYGYLNRNITGKDKRSRNIKIIEELLQNDSDNPFILFNMGNEYFALGEYSKAFEYYKKSYKNFNPNLAFSPKLIIRMVMALEELMAYDEELKMIDTGLKYYPGYTDLEYLRGCLYHKQHKYTLSIKSLEKCIEMGEPLPHLSFILGVGSYRAYHALSEIYLELEDYDKSYIFCIESLKSKPNFLVPLYRIAKILIKKGNSIESIKSVLEGFFGLNLDGPAYIVLSDIFFSEGRYEIALDYLLKAETFMKESLKILYSKGVCLLCLKDFKRAYDCFSKIESGEFYESAVYNMALCEILQNNIGRATKLLNRAKEFESTVNGVVYTAFKNLVAGRSCEPISTDKNESVKYLQAILDLLNMLLKLSEFKTFEKALKLLNLIENDEVLLKLAKLYYNNGFYKLAYQEFMRSIKIFEKIDEEGLDMMRKSLWKIIN